MRYLVLILMTGIGRQNTKHVYEVQGDSPHSAKLTAINNAKSDFGRFFTKFKVVSCQRDR